MLRNNPISLSVIVSSLLLSVAGLLLCKPALAEHFPKRIISLAPSITETLYAIGVGEKVVGVTQFCDYPPATANVNKVGGLTNPNYEAIIALRPDLIIMLGEHGGAKQMLNSLGLKTLSVEQERISQILDSIETIAIATGAESAGKRLRVSIEAKMEAFKKQISHLKGPRVMVTVGGHFSSKVIDKVYIAGRDTFYDDLINFAGGQNIYRQAGGYMSVSAEGLLTLNPNVIIDLVPNTETDTVSIDKVLQMWQSLPLLAAVRTNRVYIFTDEYTVNPGPRFILTLRKFVEALHPGLNEVP